MSRQNPPPKLRPVRFRPRSSGAEDRTTRGVAITELLDGIDGAYERAQLGLEQAHRGQTTALDDL